MTKTPELLLRDLRLPDGQRADIRIAGAMIAEIGPELPVVGDEVTIVDGAGDLVLPGLVDGHMHLDKSLIGLPWMPHPAGPTRESRIETEKRLRETLPLSVEERAAKLLRQAIAFGTATLRTHVDIDPEAGLRHLHAVLAVRERFRGLVDMQIVAFPQSGVVRAPGVAKLLDAAIAEGADLVGGIDPIGYDGDLDGQLDVVFGIAERRDVDVDLHIHDSGPTGCAELEAIAERTRALGLQGRATVSHGFCLGAASESEFDRLADVLAEAGVSIATHGGGASPIPPIKTLRDRGVRVFAGSDNIRDTWSPYGNGDMLERAMLIGWRSGFRTDADLELALDLATEAGAAALGLEAYGIAAGRRADLTICHAETPAQAVVARPPRTLVVKGGRIVARDGVFLSEG